MTLGLFDGYGVELEYAIVDRDSLAVRPLASRLLTAAVGSPTDNEDGVVGWSNEIVEHVIELKTNGPTAALTGWTAQFLEALRRIEALLGPMNAMLLPTGMHPLMLPDREARLWPHEGWQIYEAYDRIFDCRRHGFANIQSAHLNLSFDGDEEFARLHAAVRVVLPLLPALAASSPIVEGRVTGHLDTRLWHYRLNQALVPQVIGRVIPEPVGSRDEYEARILHPMYDAIRPYDPEGVLCFEFLNSRGAIARFDRSAIEIRLLDTQETPRADLAVARIVAGVVRALVEERWAPLAMVASVPTDALAALLAETAHVGPRARLGHETIARCFGSREAGEPLAAVWRRLAGEVLDADDVDAHEVMGVIADHGTVAERIVARTGRTPSQDTIVETYRELAACLRDGRLFP